MGGETTLQGVYELTQQARRGDSPELERDSAQAVITYAAQFGVMPQGYEPQASSHPFTEVADVLHMYPELAAGMPLHLLNMFSPQRKATQTPSETHRALATAEGMSNLFRDAKNAETVITATQLYLIWKAMEEQTAARQAPSTQETRAVEIKLEEKQQQLAKEQTRTAFLQLQAEQHVVGATASIAQGDNIREAEVAPIVATATTTLTRNRQKNQEAIQDTKIKQETLALQIAQIAQATDALKTKPAQQSQRRAATLRVTPGAAEKTLFIAPRVN